MNGNSLQGTPTDCGLRVDQLISAQARRTPGAVAAMHGSRSLSYLELDRACDLAATRLRALGVIRGTLVGVHLERSLDMLVAVIAVMKAGGAYVPLDPEYPSNRLGHMVADAGLGLVISQSTLSGMTPPGQYRCVDVAQLLEPCVDASADMDASADSTADATDLVYVLYTSGSTGMPKGVALEHRNVTNVLLSMQQQPGLAALDRLVAVTTLSFDIAALELFLPLIAGATVVIASRDEAADGGSLRALLESCRATVLQATPTTWRLLIDAGWQGSRELKALCGGESLPPDLARMLLPRCGELWNLYGPTETAIWSSAFRVVDADAPVLIGRPIRHTRIYVLDRSGRPVPIGIPGELFIAGAGVSRGYLNRPELTAQRFLLDPFSAEPGSRMYRTGDLGRYLADGNLEFRNRIDNQVKIRGFRVELGDIEAALESHPLIKQAVAGVDESREGDPRLVAYVLPRANAPVQSELRDYLRTRLPRYMVPQHLAVVQDFPLTPNGKVDRKTLQALQIATADAGQTQQAREAHADPQVEYLVSLWSELLGVAVAPHDNFFDLGGHSMLAVQMVNRVAIDTGVRIKLVRLASHDLAKIAADLPGEAEPGARIGRGAQLIRSAKRILDSMGAR